MANNLRHTVHARRSLRGGAVLLLLAATALGIPARAGGEPGTSRVPLPQVTIYKGDECVAPVEDMRRNHFEYILHQRDETVHKGIRTKRFSLKNCIDCHADPKTNSVLGKDGFCESCHVYAGVRIDCFSCHSDAPQEDAAADTAQRAEGAARALSPSGAERRRWMKAISRRLGADTAPTRPLSGITAP